MALLTWLDSLSTPAVSFIAILLLVCGKFTAVRHSRQLPYPPGPVPRWPLLGNIFDLPSVTPWVTYSRWGKQYGDLVYVSALGQHTVIVNSETTANEVLEAQSSIYSDRPKFAMITLIGWGFNLGFLPYGNRWRRGRRLFHQHFRSKACVDLRATQLKIVHNMLRGFIASPQAFMKHTKTFSAAVVMSTIYGHEIDSMDDRFVEMAEKSVRMLTAAVFPGAMAVNAVPALRHLPEWFPGAGFQSFARECREMLEETVNAPFDYARTKMKSGMVSPSFVSAELYKNDTQNEEQETLLKEVAATAYAAGTDTTTATIMAFILAMVLNPRVQRKAQAEIDCVVGTRRLPEYEDREQLPYIEAVYRECLRWHPVVPLGVSHAVTEDNIYKGQIIPKGTTVVSNIWAMTRNEAKYPNPEKFEPERFLTSDGRLSRDDVKFAFGFGRRICVGRHLADASLWGVIVSVLATFNICSTKDEYGSDIAVEHTFTEELVSHPGPFQCSIVPRSDEAWKLVQATAVL